MKKRSIVLSLCFTKKRSIVLSLCFTRDKKRKSKGKNQQDGHDFLYVVSGMD